jgi:hypothetical protein
MPNFEIKRCGNTGNTRRKTVLIYQANFFYSGKNYIDFHHFLSPEKQDYLENAFTVAVFRIKYKQLHTNPNPAL